MGLGRVDAAALDADVEEVGRRHDRAGTQLDRPVRTVGLVVQAVDLVAGEFLEQPVREHGAGAAEAMLDREMFVEIWHRAAETEPEAFEGWGGVPA